MNKTVLKYWEHITQSVVLDLQGDFYEYKFKKTHRNQNQNQSCFTLTKTQENHYQIKAGYFIGLDWIDAENALYIAPKLNKEGLEIDFTKMLFSILNNPEILKDTDELFEIKWNERPIEIEQKEDLLTPFLVVEFLVLVKNIVRKGLKKSYYKVEKKLQSRIKGKILVDRTVKQKISDQKKLCTYCRYEVYGYDNKENRLLKKALLFIQKCLPQYTHLNRAKGFGDIFNYINPAFTKVTNDIEVYEMKFGKTSVFYPEYNQALKLAKLILRRFGYNISNTAKNEITTPPFWIDMSKLFELYILGLLKKEFSSKVQFQFKTKGNALDYLLNSERYKMVIDAKYKTKYMKKGKVHKDIRQVSGYARLKKVYKELNKTKGQIIDCLIIYPDQDNGVVDLRQVNLKRTNIEGYHDVYKLGVQLPQI